jgi:hypothetical protein
MSKNAALQCRCREVRGLVTKVSPSTMNRVVCYCDDCRRFSTTLAARTFSMRRAAPTLSRSPRQHPGDPVPEDPFDGRSRYRANSPSARQHRS